MSELFRREAIERTRRRLDGEVLLAVPLPSRIFGLLAAAVVVGAFLFAASATYARKETVQGWITPPGGLIRVQARQAGVAADVAEPGAVRSGAILVRAVSSVDIGGGTAADLIGAGITAEAEADARQLTARLQTLEAETDRAANSLEIGQRELAALERRLELQEEQLRLARGVVEQSRSLAERGYLPKRELDARISAALSAEEYVVQLQTQKLALERQSGEARARLREIPVERDALSAQASAARAQLGQRATDVASQGRFVVTAPINGRLQEITVRRGQSFAAGDTVAVLTPMDPNLEVELFIPARAIGFVRPGQEVRVMLDAFPYEKFGSSRGSIISISATSLAPGELGSVIVPVREPVYRTRVRLDRTSVNAYGAEAPLRAGMTVTADIIVDRRTLLEWLLDPLYATGRRG